MKLIKEINEIKFIEKEIKKLIKTIESKIILLKKEQSSLTQIDIIDEINSLRNHYLTLYWCSYIGYLKNIKDKKY